MLLPDADLKEWHQHLAEGVASWKEAHHSSSQKTFFDAQQSQKAPWKGVAEDIKAFHWHPLLKRSVQASTLKTT